MAPRAASREEAVARLVELFRTHGYDGVSLSRVTAATGLGKGSLFNYFPGGKEEMANAALDHIDGWFETRIFAPLRAAPTASAGLIAMLDGVEAYFHSGRRACLMAVFALESHPNPFSARIGSYFRAWLEAIASAVERDPQASGRAQDFAEDMLSAIQGGLLLAIALNEPARFTNTIERLRRDCCAHLAPCPAMASPS